jgi:hypothetical protein
MQMFNKKAVEERIGSVKKSTTLGHLKEVEKYFSKQIQKYKIEVSYDVVANELPHYKTINYTEWAHCFMMHPLQQELRIQQMLDAYNDTTATQVDYVEYFKDRVTNRNSNKYEHIDKVQEYTPREALVILVGSNKLKERICLNKLQWIKDKHEDEVWFKPHPLTTHQLIGELKDLFGSTNVTERDADMYKLLLADETEVVYTSHMSESAVYAVCLDKTIEPIDSYNKVEQGSFYHVNKFLFTQQDPKSWVNRALSSPKSGIINPEVDVDWRAKVDAYLDYTTTERAKYKDKYVYK